MKYTEEQINEIEDVIGNLLYPHYLILSMQLDTGKINKNDIENTLSDIDRVMKWIRSLRRK